MTKLSGKAAALRVAAFIFCTIQSAFGAAATSEKWQNGSLVFAQREWVAAPVFAGADAWATVQVSNPSNRIITITNAVVRSGFALGDGLPLRLEPGQQGEFRIGLKTAGSLGRTAARIGVYTDEIPESRRDPKLAPYRLSMSVFVRSAYDPASFIFDFGIVDQAKGLAVKGEFGSRDVESLVVSGTRDATGWVNVEAKSIPADPQRKTLLATLKPGAPLGDINGVVEVETNVPDQPKLVVPYRAQVYGDIVPEQIPLDYGMTTAGQPTFHFLELSSRTGKAFKVESIADAANGIRTHEVGECVKPRPGCVSLKLVFYPDTLGFARGVLHVNTVQDGTSVAIPISYTAVVNAKAARQGLPGLPQ